MILKEECSEILIYTYSGSSSPIPELHTFAFCWYLYCFDIILVTDFPWEGTAIASNFSRKCEALAVSGFVDYGDEIDIIAPADILKQIFKIPYSKARLSIAVHRIGHTLVLNTGYCHTVDSLLLPTLFNAFANNCCSQIILLVPDKFFTLEAWVLQSIGFGKALGNLIPLFDSEENISSWR